MIEEEKLFKVKEGHIIFEEYFKYMDIEGKIDSQEHLKFENDENCIAFPLNNLAKIRLLTLKFCEEPMIELLSLQPCDLFIDYNSAVSPMKSAVFKQVVTTSWIFKAFRCHLFTGINLKVSGMTEEEIIKSLFSKPIWRLHLTSLVSNQQLQFFFGKLHSNKTLISLTLKLNAADLQDAFDSVAKHPTLRHLSLYLQRADTDIVKTQVHDFEEVWNHPFSLMKTKLEICSNNYAFGLADFTH
jgi:hypothetical protein